MRSKIKENINYLLVALLLLGIVIFSEIFGLISLIFKDVYYGNLIYPIEKILKLIFGFVALKLVFKFFKQYFEREKQGFLPAKRVVMISILVIIPIMIIAYYLNWQVKVAYLIGLGTSLLKIINFALNGFTYLLYLYFAVLMLSCFDKFFNKVLPEFKLKQYIPFAGLALMLTFGVFGLFAIDFGFKYLNLFYCLYYDIIFILTNKDIKKTYQVMLILTLL